MTLLHAYGPADDTPGHLAALTGTDPAAREAAQRHLWSAIIHQGTPWTATGPTALTVAGLISDPRLADDPGLRANLLTFLAAVAEAGHAYDDLDELAPPLGFDVDAALEAAGDDSEIYGDEILANAVYARAVQGCRDVTPALLAAGTESLSDQDQDVRGAAAHLVESCRSVLSPADAAAVADRLTTLAAGAAPDERAALVLSLGELGFRPGSFLDDPHPGVRACAALAPALADDPRATAELLAALADPSAIEGWFATRPPQFSMHVRFPLVHAAIARVDDPADLLPAALAIAPIAGVHTVRDDWGPLLHAFFPAGPGDALSPAQKHYLNALVANPDLWVPTNGTAGLVFRDAGLPYDREECRALAS
ncbi:hypothetical protein AB0M02_26470 [Actinoplanes sp. NPDC051861]|uniref:hypothetical protein n=1 Tax=Actinoplanes sp. NPDC051861 TaxID=3155170 RepID=UPI0034476F2D